MRGIFGYIGAAPAASILPAVRFDGPGVGPGTHRDLVSRTAFPWRSVLGMVSPPLSSMEDSKSDGEVANERRWMEVPGGFTFDSHEPVLPDASTSDSGRFRVENSGQGSWGLYFSAFLDRRNGDIGTHLGWRRGQ